MCHPGRGKRGARSSGNADVALRLSGALLVDGQPALQLFPFGPYHGAMACPVGCSAAEVEGITILQAPFLPAIARRKRGARSSHLRPDYVLTPSGRFARLPFTVFRHTPIISVQGRAPVESVLAVPSRWATPLPVHPLQASPVPLVGEEKVPWRPTQTTDSFFPP